MTDLSLPYFFNGNAELAFPLLGLPRYWEELYTEDPCEQEFSSDCDYETDSTDPCEQELVYIEFTPLENLIII